MALRDHHLSDDDLIPYIRENSGKQLDDNTRTAALIKQQTDPDTGWRRLIDNMKSYSQNKSVIISVKGVPVHLSLNITRTPSLTASTFELINARPSESPCLLCNLDEEQKGVLTLDDRYIILANPGITIPGDLTISSTQHESQLITGHFEDMIRLSELLTDYSIFFNGALAGASSPHFHFQAGVKDTLIGEQQINEMLNGKRIGDAHATELFKTNKVAIYFIRNFLRPCYVCVSVDKNALIDYYDQIYSHLLNIDREIAGIPNVPDFGHKIDSLGLDEFEPRMNIMLKYDPDSGTYMLAVFPKVFNRPSLYFEPSGKQIILGIAIKEALGHLITCRESDYNRLKQFPEIVEAVYTDTSLNSRLIDRLSGLIKSFN
jgi:hypothetical protein